MERKLLLERQLERFLKDAKTADLKNLQFLLEHPEYEHRPVTMEEFLSNEEFVTNQDKPRPHNKKILIDVFDSGDEFKDFTNLGKYEEVLYISGIGCHKEGTPILMYSGEIRNVEDVVVGDLLMGSDSSPREVLSLHHGKEKMFEVAPVKGNPFIVNESHILSLKRTNMGIDGYGHKDHKAGSVINISVGDYLQFTKKMQGILKLWRTGVDFQERDTPIDPYFLGLWLGDGNNNRVGITTMDREVRESVYEQAQEWKLKVNINYNKNKRCPTYFITTGTNHGGYGRNKILEEFKNLNLLNNKHIPKDYKLNSRNVRLNILAGLIDSDGSQRHNCLSFSNKRKVLCEDVVYLCRSLGFAAYMRKRETTCNGKRFSSYGVSISGDLSEIPTRLRRKSCQPRRQKKNVLVTGFSVNPLAEGNYYGFSIDGNGLYMLGDFTVTHNSGKSYTSSMAITYIIYRLLCLKDPQSYFTPFAKGTKIAFLNISTSFSQAKDIVFGEIKNRIDNNKWFQKNFPPDPRIKSLLRFPKNIYVLPVGSNEEAPLGYNIFGAIIDEASFHTLTKDKDYAEEAYHQIKKRIRSRFPNAGKIFIITSPRYVYDFAEKKWEDNKDNPKVYKKRSTTWDALPPDMFCGKKFDLGEYLSTHAGTMVPIEYEDDFRQNPERAIRDYGAQPSQSIQGFFNNPDIIFKNANYNRMHPINPKNGSFFDWFYNRPSKSNYDSEKRFIHVDLGLNKDGKGDFCGIAMGKHNGWVETARPDGRIEKRPKIFIDFMLQVKAKPQEEIKFEDVRKIIYRLRDIGYNIHLISYDGWNSADSIQILNSAGFRAELYSVDRKPDAYYTLKAALLDNRLDYYPYKPFMTELAQLEEHKAMKIDHPRSGRKDCCLSGNTMIRLLNGTSVKIKDLVGKEFEVYSCDPDGSLRVGKATNVVRTGIREDMLKVTLDNGRSIECTSNHPFMLWDSTYRMASDLRIGDSIMPLYRDISRHNSKTGLDGYERILDNSSGKWVFTHQLVAGDILGFSYTNSIKRREVIHHRDFNKLNNASSNLQIMGWDEHRDYHNKFSKDNLKRLWERDDFRRNCVIRAGILGKKTGRVNITKYNKSPERIAKLKKCGLFSRNGTTTMRKLWNDPEFVARQKARVSGSNNPIARKDITLRKIIKILIKTGSQEETLAILGCDQAVLYRLLREANIDKHEFGKRYYKSKHYNMANRNHVVTKIEHIPPAEVFDMTVRKYSNFALDAGVFVHNSDAVSAVCAHIAKGTPGRGVLGA